MRVSADAFRAVGSGGLALLLALVIPDAARAQWSNSGTRAGHGLTVDSEFLQVDSGGGYFPVRVQLQNARGPRQLRVVVEGRTFPGYCEVSRVVDLPANGRVRFTLSVPVTGRYFAGEVRVYEAGRELKKLTSNVWGLSSWNSFSSVSQVLVVGQSPDTRTMNDAVGRIGFGQSYPGQQFGRAMAPHELPTKWIDLTPFDFLAVSIGDLEQMPTSSHEAIVAWTLTGGNLLVFGLGDNWEQSAELERVLDLSRRPPAGAAWRRPKPSDRKVDDQPQPQQWIWSGGRRVMLRPTQPTEDSAGEAVAAKTDGPVQPHFSVRPFGLGQLVAMSTANPFPGTLEDWTWVLKTAGTNGRMAWTTRHGITARGGNNDFWNFLIPGVGVAPVGLFQLSILLFALVIGPLNYWLLRKRRRLYLLTVTVPSLALLTTLLLFSYAIASDGFAIRVRVRSATLLDQRRGEAVSWSRVSYFAGLAPASGLRFSSDTAVYPIPEDDSAWAHRSIDWTGEQHLARGWLPSRAPTQFLAVGYCQTEAKLAVTSAPGGAVTVTNHLGGAIRALVLADDTGAFHACEELASGESTKLRSDALDETLTLVRKLVGSQKLEMPKELSERDLASDIFGVPRFNADAVEPNRSVLEELIARTGQDAARLGEILPPRSYLAITDRLPHVELGGLSETIDAGSLYVVWGSY